MKCKIYYKHLRLTFNILPREYFKEGVYAVVIDDIIIIRNTGQYARG